MKIAVNAVLAYEQPRGVGNYLNAILPALAKIDKINEYYIYYGKWMGNYGFTKIKQDNFHLIELDINNGQIKRNLFLAIKLPQMVKRIKADIYWVPDSQATFIKPCKMISTIHDLAEFEVPEKYSPKTAMIRRMYIRRQVRLSDRIITVSEYSKKDICSRFGLSDKKVVVTYAALSETISKQVQTEPEDYFLCVGEIERAKNLRKLIEAYIMLDDDTKQRYGIKAVGRHGNCYDEIIDLIGSNGIGDKVKLYGYLSNEEINDMYARAYAFVFPSLFEGFGLPVLEAMVRGVPVLCSNVSSIPEVGGDAVLTFDPHDAGSICEQLKKIIDNDDLRKEMIEKGLVRSRLFSIDNVAQKTHEVITDIC